MRKNLHCTINYLMKSSILNFFANSYKSLRNNKMSLPYEFPYFNPYTSTITPSPKSTLALNPHKLLQSQTRTENGYRKNEIECDSVNQDITKLETALNCDIKSYNLNSKMKVTVDNLHQDVSNCNSTNADATIHIDHIDDKLSSEEQSVMLLKTSDEEKCRVLMLIQRIRQVIVP